MKRKALLLLSGGLDSQLALRLILKQPVEVEAVTFLIPFHAGVTDEDRYRNARKAANAAPVRLTTFDVGEEFLEILKSPAHGFGKGMNPCIDCRILMLKKAGEYMRRTGADFLVTGEVVGERPMSQRRHMIQHIEKASGMSGLVVRPLSARLLPPSIPEQEGWVDRTQFFDMHGRSRKPQMKLAEELGLKDYPTPAGGCLLTDPGFTTRVRDLLEHHELTLDNVELLKVGRHFRLSPNAKLVVGREEAENDRILALTRAGDWLIELADIPGPTSLARGSFRSELLQRAAAITIRYSKARDECEVRVHVTCSGAADVQIITTSAMGDAELQRWRI